MDLEEIHAWIKHKISYQEFQSRIQAWLQEFGGLCSQEAAALLAAHEYGRIPCPIDQLIPGYWFLVAGKLSYLSRKRELWNGILMDSSAGIGIWIQDREVKLGESILAWGPVFWSGSELKLSARQLSYSPLEIEPSYTKISKLKPGFYYNLVAEICEISSRAGGFRLVLEDSTGKLRAWVQATAGFQLNRGDWIAIRCGLMLRHGLWIGPRSSISKLEGLQLRR